MTSFKWGMTLFIMKKKWEELIEKKSGINNRMVLLNRVIVLVRISKTGNLRKDRMNPGVRILPLPSDNGLLGGRVTRQRSGQLIFLSVGNYPWRRMNHSQQHENVERIRKYYSINNFPQRRFSFKSREKRKSEHHSGATLQTPLSSLSSDRLTIRALINQSGYKPRCKSYQFPFCLSN